MNTLFVMLQATGQGGGYSFFIMIGLMIAVMYFFMIRPQNKRQKEIQKFRNSLAIGQKVITSSGIYGTIREINDADNSVVLEIASNVKVTIDKAHIFANPADAATPQK